MKNQYFGDRRDFFKYELLLDLVSCVQDGRILLIPMLTANDDTREGSFVGYSRGSRRTLLFECLRATVASGERDVRILRTLLPNFGVRYTPYRDADYFADATRTPYFDGVPTEDLKHAVVFFDPDVGLESGSIEYRRKSGANKYLRYADLSAIWSRAPNDSVFVVYQHLQRNAKRRKADLARRLRDVITHLSGASAWAIQWADLAFLVAAHKGQSATRVGTALAEHARRHGAVLSESTKEGNAAGPDAYATEPIEKASVGRGGSRRVRLLKGTRMANAPKMTTCKVQSESGWTTISVSEALARNERNGRCVRCEMPVRAHRLATNGMAAHFEHVQKNPSCSLITGVSGSQADQGHASRKSGHREPQSKSGTVTLLTVEDLTQLKRRLSVVLDSLDRDKNPRSEGIRKRINRLSQDGGPIPRKIAALMVTITEFRNSAEHEAQIPTATESDTLRTAWRAINEWAQSGRGRE